MKTVLLDPVADEYRILVAQFAGVQRRCSELFSAQQSEIDRLQAEVMRLRGELIARDTALALAREERAALEAALPGLPRRVALARRVDSLMEKVHALMGELRAHTRPEARVVVGRLHRKAVLCVGNEVAEIRAAQKMVERAGGEFVLQPVSDEHDLDALEASLAAADLVICQTGCIGHDAYWRVQDHCRRTGKQCVLVDAAQRAEVETLTAEGRAGSR
ncbi:DUF2325 domain-containing protein [Pseudothauera lacus]|nr:DUF2325 domain-containing protein [Pseudothauera lacus]